VVSQSRRPVKDRCSMRLISRETAEDTRAQPGGIVEWSPFFIMGNALTTRIGNNWMHNFEWLLALPHHTPTVGEAMLLDFSFGIAAIKAEDAERLSGHLRVPQ
jgi:hypothetical protein